MQLNGRSAAILIGCFVLALVLVTPAVIHADDWNLATKFTVSQPFEVPGMVLQPNTRYVIRLQDSQSDRHIVQIYNSTEQKMLTTFLAIADERTQPEDRTVFSFIETQPGYPLPIKEWFYPGRLNGVEFVYPKEQAREIAQHALEPVLSASNNNLEDLASIKVEAADLRSQAPVAATTAVNFPPKADNAPVVEEKPSEIAQNNNESTVTKSQSEEVQREKHTENTESTQSTVAPSTAPSTTEQSTTSSSTEQNNSNTSESHELPRTAGELPLITLIGALCLGGGLGLKVLSSRS